MGLAAEEGGRQAEGQLPASEELLDGAQQPLDLPPGLLDEQVAFPTVFVDTGRLALREARPADCQRVNEALAEAFDRVHPGPVAGQALLKVHIGEPRCATRMRPEHAVASARFLRDRGASGVVAGDTTVAYTGPRGHRRNPVGDASTYLALAREHGWAKDGPAGVPFVVLDRPSTALAGAFEFGPAEERRWISGVERFGDFYLAGGFGAADFVVNHAHLTLHGLAGVAGCVKSLAMGCTSLPGKLRMHQSLFPRFDEDKCVLCGQCVESCPAEALHLPEGAARPVVDKDACIGCGECVAVCAVRRGAVRLRGETITNWQRGMATLGERMTDYALGLMNGTWRSTIHVLHLYAVTPLCDCLNTSQTPMVGRDVGFLVGKNPFAIDLLGARKLIEVLQAEGQDVEDPQLHSAQKAAAYAARAYAVLQNTPMETIDAS
ncbi:MAG: DUF362 domain-containing protein [Candidatus Brocadiia bacterium]